MKFSSCSAAFLMMMGVGSAANVHATPLATIGVSPVAPTANVGERFVVDVRAGSVIDLYAFQFDLLFDPAIVSAVGSTEGAFLPSAGPTLFVAGVIDNLVGRITATASSLLGALPGASGDGSLASFEFDAKAVGATSLSLANLVLLDSNLDSIGSIQADGAVTVRREAGVPEPATLSLAGLSIALLGWRQRRGGT